MIIDGLDGSGKSTQAQILLETLKKKKKTACIRLHPECDNWFGVKARFFLFSNGTSAHFASAIFYMLDVVRSILLYSWRKTDFVVFVRYLMGTAYLPSPLHAVAYNFFSKLVPKSNAMFFLDVTPSEAAARMKNRGETEMFESLAALKKVRGKALALTRFDEWEILDSNKPASEVSCALQEKLFVK